MSTLKLNINILPETYTNPVLKAVLESFHAVIRAIDKEEMIHGMIGHRNAGQLHEKSRTLAACVPRVLKERSEALVSMAKDLADITKQKTIEWAHRQSVKRLCV